MFSNKFIGKLIIFYFSSRRKINPAALENVQLQIKKILIIRQHNQFGDLLASVSLFRAIKEAYPQSSITVVTSPDNNYALTKNKFIDRNFVFRKKDLKNPSYVFRLLKILKADYDVCIVPVTVAISTTSCLLAGFSDAKLKIGPAELNGKKNKYNYIFDEPVKMDWRKNPERNVADFGQDILKPLEIRTANLASEISFDKADLTVAEEFIDSFVDWETKQLVVGLHVGAGKIPNRWAGKNFAELIKLISGKYDAAFYLTGTDADLESINEVLTNSLFSDFEYLTNSPQSSLKGEETIGKIRKQISNRGKAEKNILLRIFLNKSVPEVAALISKSDLFITNDTGIMHVAGVVNTPQISIFGPTKPNNWAPVGENKYWLKKGNNINSVSVLNVFEVAEKIINESTLKNNK